MSKSSGQPEMKIAAMLPLTPTVFEILLSLIDQQRHGYDIMGDVERRTEGRMVIRPGSLYRAIHRLLERGVVEEVGERPAPEVDDERRRYYRITPLGRGLAAAEAERMRRAVSAARAKKLIGTG